MRTGYMSSSESKKCKVCGKKTNDYRTFNQSEMTVVVPVCESHWKDEGMALSEVEFKSGLFLKEINKIFK